ncbi:MAG: polyribonucleotide nucleotidyltransferase [Candidatus Portnoybacteria bacterium CG10_big_fil_rev_8_21_14_0_10_36_7]|uniref:Polyribonucleotide nucleotidyltransferase n=1 Tax=Candidatus Portnoybacteria bacterium CG10_big_fil_rev_8_21_14_0_10_36_7 TaxID=1974812 RepID=A0A2M8KF19_9BACT|nr:MAG: polyribonucleotide nucleotidyltransferase [Candidatus Portnoybacteria bacterium CG10_big_fil_rev_8_21_14_0_10_36_7]
MEEKQYKLSLGSQEIYLKINQMACQANGRAIVGYGDTMVLVTAVMGREPRANIDWFPLSVDYEERFYAAGKIKGSRYVKREGRSTDEAILTARVIDRAIRPRFNHKQRNEVQVVATTISFDQINDPDVIALNGASLALSLSDIPWDGPVGCVRIGLLDGKFIINPTYEERTKCELDIVVAGTEKRINMLEGGANETPEEKVAEAISLAHKEIKKIIAWQKEIVKDISPVKADVLSKEPSEEFKKIVNNFLDDRLEKAVYTKEKGHINELKRELMNYLREQEHEECAIKDAGDLFEDAINDLIHKNIVENDKRPDGRETDELRNLECYISLLPRVHGSALFVRGTTQALSSTTLGSPGMEQYLDSMELSGTKTFMHHYNFPPYSVGETSPNRGPGRREIGHGALAERSLLAVIPPRSTFPYTIRVVSEILSSNGSSSMASVCGASLSLMDAGVPIKAPVAGIAMGLMGLDDGRYKVLTDIQGPEDHHGDMDCKIAGTKDGVTGVQMDVKIEGVTPKMIAETLTQAKKARLEILSAMAKAIEKPKTEVSAYAPKIVILEINPEKIGAVIGPGGKVINEIIAQTGVMIDIEDSGQVFITSEKKDSIEKAVEWIKNLTREIKVGETFNGKVVKIMEFGAFVEILPGQDGLVHISELADYRVNKVSDIVKEGDIIPVKIKTIDNGGKISLSLKAARNGNNTN